MSNNQITKRILTAAIFIVCATTASAATTSDDVVRDSNGKIIHLENGTCVRTIWQAETDSCAPFMIAAQQQETQTKAAVTPTVANTPPIERAIYFKFDRFTLSPEGKERLNALVNTYKSDRSVKAAKIVGYADRIGTASYNDRLSQKRAVAVRDYLLTSVSTKAPAAETRWAGESQPTTNCPTKQTRSHLIDCLQNDRRVDVELEYNQEKPTSDTH